MQEISNILDESLSAEEKEAIYEQERYAHYKEIYDGDMDAVWQEFVCDTMSGMNDYTEKYIDTVNDYWYGDESVERYNPADYATSTDAGGERYSLGDVNFSERPFAEQVDAVLSGEDTVSTHLQISEHTPKLLLDLGLSDKPILITSVHTKTALGYKVRNKNIHYISTEVFKKLPQLVENPAMVMESTKKGSIVMFVNALDKDNNPVVCSIKIDGKGNFNNVEVEANVVTSVYGKDTNPTGFIEKAVDDNRVLYWNKKMSQELFDTPGLQLPDNIIALDSNVIIRKISENVNTKISNTDSAGRKLSEGQIEYFKDSKERDEGGNLKVMYRGDKENVTVFDRKKAKASNLYGRGFYFTDSKSHAEQYGNATEYYLEIKNPLSPKQNAITKEQMLNFLKAIENNGEDYDLYNYGQDATAESVLNSVWGKGDFEMLQDVSASAVGDLVAAVKLFNEVNGTSYDGIILPTETVTFESEQAKLTSNLNPTKNKDTRFSLSKEDKLPESGELNGYEQNSNGKKLGRLQHSSKNERPSRVDDVGQIQSKKPDTPHTRKVHRSGVSAETLTSSGLTAEQAALREQNATDGVRSEFYTKAKLDGEEQAKFFNTQNSAYYPDAVFERNGISVKDGVASFTEKRFDDLIEEYSVPVGGQLNRDYAKAYVAYISPSDFLRLTTINEELIVLDTARYGKLDVEVLKSNDVRQGPYLEIDFDDGRVYEHNGRHRMVMLRDAGIDKVAIVVRDISSEQNKYKTTKHTDVTLLGQKFHGGESAPGKVTLDEIIPLSPNYRNEVREKFVDTSATIRYSGAIWGRTFFGTIL